MGYTMRTNQIRYTEWHSRKDLNQVVAHELYDHRDNPDENENVIDNGRYTKIVEDMAARMEAGWKAACPV